MSELNQDVHLSYNFSNFTHLAFVTGKDKRKNTKHIEIYVNAKLL